MKRVAETTAQLHSEAIKNNLPKMVTTTRGKSASVQFQRRLSQLGSLERGFELVARLFCQKTAKEIVNYVVIDKDRFRLNDSIMR